MKKLLTIVATLLVTLVFASGAMAATAADAPENIKIDQAQKKQPAVDFPHKAHWELTECTTCHHTQEGLTAESTDEVETCASCHLNPAEATTPSMAEMSLKKNPYHMGCISCHKEQKKGPVKCADCHKK